MVAGFISERWPASNRNPGRLHVGTHGRIKSESALDFVVFCFAKPEDADAFSERFAGEHLSGDARRSP